MKSCFIILRHSLIFCLLLISSSAVFGQREALLAKFIINDQYEEVASPEVSREQFYELADLFTEMGYEVIIEENLDRDLMIYSLQEMHDTRADELILIYAGYTYHDKTGDYIVPVNATVKEKKCYKEELIALDELDAFNQTASSVLTTTIFDVQSIGKKEADVAVLSERLALLNDHTLPEYNLAIFNDNDRFLSQGGSALMQHFINTFPTSFRDRKASLKALKSVSSNSGNSNCGFYGADFPDDIAWGDSELQWDLVEDVRIQRGEFVEVLRPMIDKEPDNEPTTENLKVHEVREGAKAVKGTKHVVSPIESPDLMPAFPFPPPKASARYLLDASFFTNSNSLYDVSQVLDQSLTGCGYHERSYFQVPKGFALVTRVEKIKTDVSPYPVPERWEAPGTDTKSSFSLMDYLKALFYAKEGRYRILVFIVSAEPFVQSEKEMSLDEAEYFLRSGFNTIADAYKQFPYTDAHDCTVLIYEFSKLEHEEAEQISISAYQGLEHLTKNQFLPTLRDLSK